MAVFRDEEAVSGSFADSLAERHCFGSRGGFIEQRGVGNFQPGQFGDHRLVVEENFEAAL